MTRTAFVARWKPESAGVSPVCTRACSETSGRLSAVWATTAPGPFQRPRRCVAARPSNAPVAPIAYSCATHWSGEGSVLGPAEDPFARARRARSPHLRRCACAEFVRGLFRHSHADTSLSRADVASERMRTRRATRSESSGLRRSWAFRRGSSVFSLIPTIESSFTGLRPRNAPARRRPRRAGGPTPRSETRSAECSAPPAVLGLPKVGVEFSAEAPEIPTGQLTTRKRYPKSYPHGAGGALHLSPIGLRVPAQREQLFQGNVIRFSS